MYANGMGGWIVAPVGHCPIRLQCRSNSGSSSLAVATNQSKSNDGPRIGSLKNEAQKPSSMSHSCLLPATSNKKKSQQERQQATAQKSSSARAAAETNSIMWQRLLAVAVCMMNDRHCDPVWPIDTTVDPRYPCQADADFGTFGQLFTNNSVTVLFQYQIEMIMASSNNNNTVTAAGPPSTMAIRQVERALSNVLANSFFECRRRQRGLVRRSSSRTTTRRNHRNLQPAMPLDMLVGISASPADRVYPSGALLVRRHDPSIT
jgi:hypothetical protein